METKEWHTYKEIINMVGISKQTLNNWRKEGHVLYKKLTKRTFLYKFPEIKIIKNNEL